MRHDVLSLALIAGLLFGRPAFAAGGSGGRGGEGPGSTGSAPSGGLSLTFGGREAPPEADTASSGEEEKSTKREKKPWEVEGIWETHRLVRQSDLDGYGVNKTVNVAYLYGRYYFTEQDRLWLRGGLYQRFVADQGETGFRADDTVLGFTHAFPLPEEFEIRLSAQVSAPTSFDSQKMGLISEPRLTVAGIKRLDRFTFNLRTWVSYFLLKYSTAEGGNANPLVSWDQQAEIEYRVPLIESLSFGIAAFNEYLWNHQTRDAGNAASGLNGSTGVTSYTGQPMQQYYGGEVFARYALPRLSTVDSDITLAYAQGDPSLGYTSAMHDGVRHYYGFWRETSEVYVALAGRF